MLKGIVFQLISVLAFSCSNVLWRKLSGKLIVSKAIFFRTLFTVSFFTIINFAINDTSKNLSFSLIAFAFCISCLSYFGLYFYNKALQYAPTGMVSTVVTFSFITGQLTALFLGEAFSKGILFSFILCIAGIAVSDSASIQKYKLNKGTLYALCAAIIWGVTLTLLSIPAKAIGAYKTGLILEIAVLVMSFCQFKIAHKGKFMREEFTANLPVFALLAVFATVGVLFLNLSFTQIPAYITAGLSSIGHIITIILAYIFYKEKMTNRQLIGSFICMVAIFILFYQL